MATVKNLALFSKDKIKGLTPLVDFECNTGSMPPVVDILHSFLPLGLKFLKESYAIADAGRVLGFITLDKDDFNSKRLIISQLFLEKNSLEYGEELINFVTNKFLSLGAKSFLTVVNEDSPGAVKLLTEVSKFRILGYEYHFVLRPSDFSFEKGFPYEFIKFAKNQQASKIADLCNSLIYSNLLPSVEINEKCFFDHIFVGLRNRVTFRYVLENSENKKIFGYFTISTPNNKDFVLEAMLAPSFEAYFSDVLKFAKAEISKRTSGWTLHVKIKSCYMNYRALLGVMQNYDFKPQGKSKILTKDLYKALKTGDKAYKGRVILNDITPAY